MRTLLVGAGRLTRCVLTRLDAAGDDLLGDDGEAATDGSHPSDLGMVRQADRCTGSALSRREWNPAAHFRQQTPAGQAGFDAGLAMARQGQSSGSIEWLVAPVLLAPFVVIFYPVASATALAVGYGVALAMTGMGVSTGIRTLVAVSVVIGMFWPLCRRDQEWGRNRAYHLARHAVRMLIMVLAVNGAAQNAVLTARDLPAMPLMVAVFTLPPRWMPVVLTIVFWQVFFMRTRSWRRYWDVKMKMWFLRPKEFEADSFTWSRPKPEPARAAPIELPRTIGGDRRR